MTTAAENRPRSDSPRRRTDSARSGQTTGAKLATDLPVLIRLPNLEQPRSKTATETKTKPRTTESSHAIAATRTDASRGEQRSRAKTSSSKTQPGKSQSSKTQPAVAPTPAPSGWGTIFWKAAVLAAAIALVALAYRIINGPGTNLPLAPPANMLGKAGKNIEPMETPKFGAPSPLWNSSPGNKSPAAQQGSTANTTAPASFSDPVESAKPVDNVPPASDPQDNKSPWSQYPQTNDTAGGSGDPAARVATRPQQAKAPTEIETSNQDNRRPWGTPGANDSSSQPSQSEPYQPYRRDSEAGADPWSASNQPIQAQAPQTRDQGFGQREQVPLEARREQYDRRTSPAPNTSGHYDYLETNPDSWRQPGGWEDGAHDAQQPQPASPQSDAQRNQSRDASRNPDARMSVRDSGYHDGGYRAGGFQNGGYQNGGVRDDYGTPGTARLQGGIEQPPLR